MSSPEQNYFSLFAMRYPVVQQHWEVELVTESQLGEVQMKPFEEMFDLSPYLEMVQPIPAPIEVLGKICDQVSSLCICLITYLRFDYRL